AALPLVGPGLLVTAAGADPRPVRAALTAIPPEWTAAADGAPPDATRGGPTPPVRPVPLSTARTR
ncbi:MAG TPA: hypothetical protein VES42_12730, partial [Pilimelia sp.]|nr:hypothetical protein [Pilimelia sp.]